MPKKPILQPCSKRLGKGEGQSQKEQVREEISLLAKLPSLGGGGRKSWVGERNRRKRAQEH